MPSNTPATQARSHPQQQVSFLSKLINYNDSDAATGSLVGTMPAGATILGTVVTIVTPFNAATTNDLTVGTVGAAYNNMVTTGQAAAGAAGNKGLLPQASTLLGRLAADTAVYAKYAQSGTAATAGVALIVVMFVANTDR